MKLAKKYLIALIAFVVIIGFLDTNSVWNRLEIRKVNDSLRQEILVYEEKSRRDSLRLDELQKNPDAIIHVAREEYFMKRPGEDIYIIK